MHTLFHLVDRVHFGYSLGTLSILPTANRLARHSHIAKRHKGGVVEDTLSQLSCMHVDCWLVVWKCPLLSTHIGTFCVVCCVHRVRLVLAPFSNLSKFATSISRNCAVSFLLESDLKLCLCFVFNCVLFVFVYCVLCEESYCAHPSRLPTGNRTTPCCSSRSTRWSRRDCKRK